MSTWTTPVFQKGVSIVGDDDRLHLTCRTVAAWHATCITPLWPSTSQLPPKPSPSPSQGHVSDISGT